MDLGFKIFVGIIGTILIIEYTFKFWTALYGIVIEPIYKKTPLYKERQEKARKKFRDSMTEEQRKFWDF